MPEGLLNEARLKIDGICGLFSCGLWWRWAFDLGYILLRLTIIRRAINTGVIIS